MHHRSVPAGIVTLILSFFGAAYLIRHMMMVSERGYALGRFGDMYMPGSAEYTAAFFASLTGVGFMLILAGLGFLWMGFFDKKK